MNRINFGDVFETTTQRRRDMKSPTLTQIRKSVEASGGEYRKLKMYLTMTKSEMIERFQMGAL